MWGFGFCRFLGLVGACGVEGEVAENFAGGGCGGGDVEVLEPKLYYGQPGYARKGTVLCFFRSGQGDTERYSTFGFTVQADLDDESGLWATSYALTEPAEAAWTELETLIGRVRVSEQIRHTETSLA